MARSTSSQNTCGYIVPQLIDTHSDPSHRLRELLVMFVPIKLTRLVSVRLSEPQVGPLPMNIKDRQAVVASGGAIGRSDGSATAGLTLSSCFMQCTACIT